MRAPAITEPMKIAAARAIAAIVEDSELREDYIIPSVFNRAVAPAVAAAVAEEARAAGSALAGQEVGLRADRSDDLDQRPDGRRRRLTARR